MRKYFPYFIGFTALFVSVIAEYFSISGLSKLFSGESIAVAILAGSLGLAKLVSVITVHAYWNEINSKVRYYIIVSTFVLVGITSIGVYGFLAHAYQVTANADNLEQQKIALLTTKQEMFKQKASDLKVQVTDLNQSISGLRTSIAQVDQTQQVDRKTGQLLTNTRSSNKQGIIRQIDQAEVRLGQAELSLAKLSDSIFFYENRIIETKSQSVVGSELGPLKFLSGLTGASMDKVVNILMLLLILVIDPLAIVLLIAAQYAFTRKEPEMPQEATTSPTSDDLPKDVQVPSPTEESALESLSQPQTEKPVKRRKVNKEKIQPTIEEQHFNVDIDPIADPSGVLLNDRKVVEAGLTNDVAESMLKTLSKKKKN